MPVSVAQLVTGSFVLWIALQREPLRMRGGDFYENQRFIRTALIILGLGLIIAGLWGLWIEWRLPKSVESALTRAVAEELPEGTYKGSRNTGSFGFVRLVPYFAQDDKLNRD